MPVAIEEIAKKHEVVPGQVAAALDDLGVSYHNGQVEADDETLELVHEAVREAKATKTIALRPSATSRDLAAALGMDLKTVQMALIQSHKFMQPVTTPVDKDIAEKLSESYGFEVEWSEAAKPKSKSRPKAPATKPASGAQPRSPVVTILGHVDHGKTSLLDHIRKENVVAGEAGGITQHIGAYQVKHEGASITFLDTPGHAAFTEMRARGAHVTDIAVLVVAADDGIMPQTIEAINHAKSAKVPIIVAVNKIDLPGANPDQIVMKLPEQELVPEEFGGDIIVCKVSAVTGEGVDHLLEMITLQADVMELTADPKAELEGVVIEAKLERGKGPVATVLVEGGTLVVGQIVVVGSTWGKVRGMVDYAGDIVKSAGPSTPVEIQGLNEVPNAGDRVEPAGDEREARTKSGDRSDADRIAQLNPGKKKMSLRDLRNKLDAGETKELNLIVKGDVHGSVEAVRGLIEKLDNPEVEIKLLHSGVGAITESDVLLASAASAIVIGFNVKPEGKAKAEARRHKVELRTYNIIYELIEDIEKAVKGMLAPKFVEEHQGTVEVRAVFNLTKIGKVAGCHVTDGKVTRDSQARVTREGELVFEGKIASLRNVKQDVRDMTAGQDCGIRFDGWTDYAVGDLIEAYTLVQTD